MDCEWMALDGDVERENTDRPSRKMRLMASDGDMKDDADAGDIWGDGLGGAGGPAAACGRTTAAPICCEG